MQVLQLSINDVHPYKNNPRINDDAIADVAESIKRFGWKQPIVIDKKHVIVVGHTRFAAAKLLGFDTVPCVISELSAKENKAYRVVDNKTNEAALWDVDKLKFEIADIDLSDFGFDFSFEPFDSNGNQSGGTGESAPNDFDYEESDPFDDISFEPNERIRTVNAYNLDFFDPDKAEGQFEIPTLAPVDYIPKSVLGFNYARSTDDPEATIHFYLDDYQFERVWNRPFENFDVLSKFEAVITPDFSLYMNMPIAMQVWNIYRSRMIGQMMQNAGLTVIPSVSWSDERSYAFCFDGLPHNSTVSLSTVGVMKSKEAQEVFRKGTTEMIKRINPKRIIMYGADKDIDYKFPNNIEVLKYKCREWNT